MWYLFCFVDRGSSVSIATRYGLDGPAIVYHWGGGEIFCTRPDRPCGPPSLLYNGYLVFPGSKWTGWWSWPPPPSSTEVKERVELDFCSTSGPSWPIVGRTLPLPFTYFVSFNQSQDLIDRPCTKWKKVAFIRFLYAAMFTVFKSLFLSQCGGSCQSRRFVTRWQSLRVLTSVSSERQAYTRIPLE